MPKSHTLDRSPWLVSTCVILAVLGSALLVVGNIVGSIVVPGHDWVADTVSDLAAGRYEIIQDVSLYGYAAGLMGLGLALAHLHPGGRGWDIGVLGLAVLAALVVVIGARNEYGDGDNEGVVIHIYLVYALGFFFTLVPFALAPGIAEVSPKRANLLRGLAVLWAVGAVIFFLLPTDIDGIWERGLGLVTIAMVLVLAYHLHLIKSD